MEYMFMPLRRYADFRGRSRRLEYWLFALFSTVLIFGLTFAGLAIDVASGLEEESLLGSILTILAGLCMLGLFIPSLAVQVRRFHDQDKSGWFMLVGLFPYIGGIILLVLLCVDGTPGENRFGADPKGRGIEDTFA